jgi:hypothetical protein
MKNGGDLFPTVAAYNGKIRSYAGSTEVFLLRFRSSNPTTVATGRILTQQG